MHDTHISLAHGNGGRYMRELIAEIFERHLGNDLLNTQADAVTLPKLEGEIMVTTDGFTVQPLEFPGGNIGSLAVHGSVNDLAVAGAVPRYLTLSVLIEEGLEIAQLERIVVSLAQAARESNVAVVCGDTKVVRRGEGGGIYITVTGVGVKAPSVNLDIRNIQPGDKILVSGPIGDHGIAVLLAREQFGLRGDLQSDAASVLPLAQALWQIPGVRFMRDPTRGGLATVMHEVNRATGYGVLLQQTAIPVRPPVSAVCETLGFDPLFLACEGQLVAVVADEVIETVLCKIRAMPFGHSVAKIGEITTKSTKVVLYTELGGERVLEELEADPLPRIC